MKMKKIVSAIAALSLVAALAIGGTLAFLKDETGAVTNNFTYNAASQNVDLKIYEHKIDPDNNTKVFDTAYTEGDDTHIVYEGESQAYTIMPGATVDKDPTLRLTSGATKVYLYAEVVKSDTNNAIANIEIADGWEKLSGSGKNGGDLYVLAASKTAGVNTGMTGDVANTVEYQVLENVTYTSTLSDDANASIAVYGYVVDAVAGTDAGTVYTETFVGAGA